MSNIQLGYDEGIILISDEVYWSSRDDLSLSEFILTNKNLYCTYNQSNGVFKKATQEICMLSLSDIKTINGQVLVQQIKYEGEWCLQIQFKQGTEYFAFSDSPKKVIPQWITAINNTINKLTDTMSTSTPTIQQADILEEKKPTFCANCGAKLMATAKFCGSCGYSLGSSSSAPTLAQKPVVYKDQDICVPSIKEETIILTPTQISHASENSIRQQEYVGKILNCPHCGEVVSQTDAICSSCGYHLSGKQAVVSAIDFQQKLLEIEMRREDGYKNEDENYEYMLNAAIDKQIISLINSYPIPNSIEDILEFFHLAVGNIDTKKSKKSFFKSLGDGSHKKAVSDAWVGKLKQIYKKAEFYFPNEPEFVHIKETYLEIMNALNYPL